MERTLIYVDRVGLKPHPNRVNIHAQGTFLKYDICPAAIIMHRFNEGMTAKFCLKNFEQMPAFPFSSLSDVSARSSPAAFVQAVR